MPVNSDTGGLQVVFRPPAGVDGGVGPVRHAMGAYAPREFRRVARQLLQLGLGHPAGVVREQVCAGILGRLELGVAHSEVFELVLRELSAAVGVGEFDTPSARTQWEKASIWELDDGECVDPPAPPEPVDDGCRRMPLPERRGWPWR